MKIKLFIIILLITITSCDNQSLDNLLPYFKFKTEDTQNLLILPELNSRITFINQNNEELHFDIVKSELGKQLYGRGNWVTSTIKKYFYYDEQEIHLRSTLLDINDIHRYIEIKVQRWPKEFNDGRNGQPEIISEESLLVLKIEHSSFNNSGPNTYINNFNNYINLTIDNKVYQKVKKINLTTTTSFSTNNWPLPSLNYLYYEINEGIIGFDDRNGNEWRLK